MKKRRAATAAAAITLSMAIGTTAFALPSDIGGHWAQPTIVQWTSKGYISGYPDGTFKPDNSITRAEFVVLVNKSMGYTKKGSAYFTDLSSSHWAYDEIMKGVSAGYISGDASGTFRPDDPVSRQEAAVMISKILDLGTDPASAAKFVDYRYIPAWSVGYVGSVTKAGIMTGYPDGDFKADRVLTRAEAVVSLNGAVNYDGKTDDNKEDYTLEATILKDKTITGDLIISSDLKTRSVSLDNVTVKGTVIVNGGGTITANDCDINKLEINSADATFVAKGDTSVKSARFEEAGSIEGKGYEKVTVDEELSDRIVIDAEIDEFILDAETDIRLLSNTVIKNFTATENADRATVSFSKAEIEDMDIYDKIKITGSGDIDTMTVYVSGVTSTIKPDSLKQKDGADKPDYVSGGSSGDIEYGGSSSRYDDYTITKDGKTVRGGKYDDVTIKADDVSLEGTTIYGDLTIHKDVKNGDATLEDVTVRGNVYVYGGGDSSVIFDGCDIRGDIIANKEVTSQAVNLVFRNSTDVDGKIRVRNNTIITSSYKLDSIVMEDTDADLELKANVAYLEFTKKGELSIDNHTVDSLTIGGSAKNSEIAMKNGAVIKTLTAKSDVTVSGKGTIEKTSGSGDITKGDEITVGVAVTGVTLDKTSAEITVGGTVTLKATVAPDNAAKKDVEWSSSDSTIASVDDKGLVTGKKAGSATITVKTVDGGKTAKCTVTVKEKTPEFVPVTGITGIPSTMNEGDSITLNGVVSPETATNQTITWSVTDAGTTGATIEGNTLKTTAAGTVKITATIKNGKTENTDYVEHFTITVSPKTPDFVAVTDITVSPLEGTAGQDLQLTATVNPTNATNKTITWSVKDAGETGAAIEGNTLSTTAAGTVTVTATITDGKGVGQDYVKDDISIEIKAEIDKSSLTNKIDEAKTALSGVKKSTNGSDISVNEKWVTEEVYDALNTAIQTAESSQINSQEDVASAVNALNEALNTFNSNIKDGLKVTVSNVTISPESIDLVVGNTQKLEATVNTDGTDKTVKWESDNKEVATVADDGTVTAVSTGTTKIKAISNADSTKSATCTVKVEAAQPTVTGVTISGAQNNGLVEKTSNLTLTATVNMSDSNTNSNVKWSSDNSSVATIDESTGAVTFQGTGSVTFTAKATADETKQASVTLNVYEITLSGDTTLNVGSNTVITANVTGITDPTFVWSFTGTEGGITLTNNNTSAVTVNGVTAGSYNLTVNITSNGQTISKTVIVTVNPSNNNP